jgi:hypothetical protein
VGDTSGTTTVRETERKYESDGPVDAGLVAKLAAAAGGATDGDGPAEFALSATLLRHRGPAACPFRADPAPASRRQ